VALTYSGIPIIVDENLPLRTTKRMVTSDYESMEIESDLLCVMFSGTVFVRPDRMWWFEQLVVAKS
jgi:hypothetical protein